MAVGNWNLAVCNNRWEKISTSCLSFTPRKDWKKLKWGICQRFE